MRRLLVSVWVGMALAAGCGGGPVINYDYSQEIDPRKTEYVIGVSDRMTIRVWKNPELSADVVVRPDGIITMPLIGDLKAVGRTPTQLKDDISKMLANFIRDEGATVTVAMTGLNSYSFTVSGNVEHPGTFRGEKYVTVLEAISLAGGPNRYASPRRLKLLRAGKDGEIRQIPINYSDLVVGKHPEANLALMTGDQLFMP